MFQISATRLAIVMVMCFLALSTTHSAPVYADQEDLLEALLNGELNIMDKRGMGWRLCNRMFKWRCGKAKTINKKVMTMHLGRD